MKTQSNPLPVFNNKAAEQACNIREIATFQLVKELDPVTALNKVEELILGYAKSNHWFSILNMTFSRYYTGLATVWGKSLNEVYPQVSEEKAQRCVNFLQHLVSMKDPGDNFQADAFSFISSIVFKVVLSTNGTEPIFEKCWCQLMHSMQGCPVIFKTFENEWKNIEHSKVFAMFSLMSALKSPFLGGEGIRENLTKHLWRALFGTGYRMWNNFVNFASILEPTLGYSQYNSSSLGIAAQEMGILTNQQVMKKCACATTEAVRQANLLIELAVFLKEKSLSYFKFVRFITNDYGQVLEINFEPAFYHDDLLCKPIPRQTHLISKALQAQKVAICAWCEEKGFDLNGTLLSVDGKLRNRKQVDEPIHLKIDL